MQNKYPLPSVRIDVAQLSQAQKDSIVAAVAEFFKEFSYESYLEEQCLLGWNPNEELVSEMPFLYGHIRIVGDFYKAVRHHSLAQKTQRA